jgi:polysaccharide export outer membrane protein
MARQSGWKDLAMGAVCASLLVVGMGCHGIHEHKDSDHVYVVDVPVPKELNKVSMPPYVVETPDVLMIDAIRIIPLPPYRVDPHDVLFISGTNVFESAPINGTYAVDQDGNLNLGPAYGGTIRVIDMGIDEIQKLVQQKVRTFAPKAEITVSLVQTHGAQQIAGKRIVRPDGTVSLGNYGSVYVAGMTLAQAKQEIEAYLSRFLYRPEISLDVFAFNSKFYYVIADMGGYGENVTRLPHTGNETVLDAVSHIGGLSCVSSKKIWVARPAPTECGHDQILPVDWKGITRRGQVITNYQILPGDRVYILSQPVSKFDTCLAHILSPFHRMVNVPSSQCGNNCGEAIVSPVIGAGF